MNKQKKRIEPSFSSNSVNVADRTHHTRAVNQTDTGNSHYLHVNNGSNIASKTLLIQRFIKTLCSEGNLLIKSIVLMLKSNNKKAILSVIAIILLTIILLTYFVFTGSDAPADTVESKVIENTNLDTISDIERNIRKRQHEINFADDFSLLTNSYNGLVISWQGAQSADTTVWDIRRTTGDKSCEKITFNTGESYRVLNVSIEDLQRYFANISPLDSADIIKALAFKNTFTLCGYSFSLKGSQALLGKHYYYSEWL